MPSSLYLTTPGSRLELEAGQLLVTRDDDLLLAVPAVRVDQVVIIGGCHVTTPALAFLLDREIDLVFLTGSGKYRGRLETGRNPQIELRRAQYRRADDAAFCLALAKAFIAGKIHNSRTRCLELDDTRHDPVVASAAEKLRAALAKLEQAGDTTAVMGIEGECARWYFDVLRQYVRPPWEMPARARRPPPDPVNALLSLLYTLLHESCRSALAVVGLDPTCGFLHAPRPGRASFALDLMEEFRPVIADSVVLTLLNKRILSPADFRRGDPEGARLNPEGWRAVAEQYAHRLNTRVQVPGRVTKTTYQKLLEVQARQLRQVILGERETYEPFRSR